MTVRAQFFPWLFDRLCHASRPHYNKHCHCEYCPTHSLFHVCFTTLIQENIFTDVHKINWYMVVMKVACLDTEPFVAIDNSSMKVFLLSASIESASHTYSCLSCQVMVGKSLLHVYGRTALTAYTVDCILTIVLSS